MRRIFKPGTRHFKLTLAYDGSDFAGWQNQRNQRTVQAELERAWHCVTQETVAVVASGRTDAGVHALAQVASVASETPLAASRLALALNYYLPDDVRVLEVVDAPDGFHAIRDAIRKRYRYVIQDGPYLDVIGRGHAWHVRRPLDVRRMHDAGQSLVGTHDFTSFESAGSHRLTTVRTVFDLTVERRRRDSIEQVVLEVEADGFLYSMVRNITGTLVAVGQGAESLEWVAEVLAARNRRRAGVAAPAQGLFLVRVEMDWPPAGVLVTPSGEDAKRCASPM